MGIISRLQNAWNAFVSDEKNQNDYSIDPYPLYYNLGPVSSSRPDRVVYSGKTGRSIISAVYTRIAIDCSQIPIKHVKVDENDKYTRIVKDSLNDCLTSQANKDQTAKHFIQDIVESMFDEGVVAVVPVDTSEDPRKTESFDILSMRTAKITAWMPDAVQVYLYDDRSGIYKYLTLPKRDVAIIENPFYEIMNERNSTLQRLIRKLNLLDYVDDQSGSGKLNLIIQLPYAVKTPMKESQADKRRKSIENQLVDSKYGIAYTDATEHITQLNRPLDNNLVQQCKDLTSMLFSQLGVTEDILSGKAKGDELHNYQTRTLKPIIDAIVDEFKVKFLTKTARTQGDSIMYFTDIFGFISSSDLPNMADALTRNAIVSSNEIRQVLGLLPSSDPKANELSNKNMPVEDQGGGAMPNEPLPEGVSSVVDPNNTGTVDVNGVHIPTIGSLGL